MPQRFCRRRFVAPAPTRSRVTRGGVNPKPQPRSSSRKENLLATIVPSRWEKAARLIGFSESVHAPARTSDTKRLQTVCANAPYRPTVSASDVVDRRRGGCRFSMSVLREIAELPSSSAGRVFVIKLYPPRNLALFAPLEPLEPSHHAASCHT
jgi:hypothetical protein